MELNDIKITIQEFFQENTVTIIGSGLSVAEGIPGMRELSIELQSKVPQRLKDEPDVANWKNIENRLNQAEGLEAALHNERPRPVLEESIREVTASFIRNADRNALNRVLLGETSFRLSAYLNRFNIRNDGLIIITTNYDRLIEYSCEMSNIRVDTLFVGKFISSFSPNESKYAFCKGISKFKSKPKVEYAPKVTVLKPHGCLSWYYVDVQDKAIPH